VRNCALLIFSMVHTSVNFEAIVIILGFVNFVVIRIW
jgi:hypothetical protein